MSPYLIVKIILKWQNFIIQIFSEHLPDNVETEQYPCSYGTSRESRGIRIRILKY